MLRCSRRWCHRPYGPLRGGLGQEIEKTPFRSEKTMTMNESFPHLEHADLRRVYLKVKKLKHTKLFGIPRDLGEIPRNYMLRLLFLNQPCSESHLWTLLKDFDDCPFDSYDHLEMVIRVALHQNWVVREKNQVDRKWYLSVHKTRSADIQTLIQQQKDDILRKEEEAAGAQRGAAEGTPAESSESLDASIRSLQHQLSVNVAILLEQDASLVQDLTFVKPDKSIDFLWHVDGGAEAVLTKAAEEVGK